MNSITFPNRIRANRRLLRIFAVASAVLLVQGTLTAPRAEANTIVDIYQAVSVGIAWDLGSKICPIACPAAAVAAVPPPPPAPVVAADPLAAIAAGYDANETARLNATNQNPR